MAQKSIPAGDFKIGAGAVVPPALPWPAALLPGVESKTRSRKALLFSTFLYPPLLFSTLSSSAPGILCSQTSRPRSRKPLLFSILLYFSLPYRRLRPAYPAALAVRTKCSTGVNILGGQIWKIFKYLRLGHSCREIAEN